MGFNAEEVPDLLGPEGPLAGELASYEDRPYQREMALEVARLLETGGKLAVEAPTGIGKSVAYGLPAALWAAAGFGPVVISTYTKALQSQWLRTEAPRLRRLVNPDLKIRVLKGRTNYLCRRRYEAECRAEGGEATRALLKRLRPWVESTATGDLSSCGERDLNYIKLKLSSDPKFCSSRECTPASGCFFKEARRLAQDADLLIVNHALLAIQLFEGTGPLPAFDALIVDEAHAFVTASLDLMTRVLGPARLASLAEAAPAAALPPWLRRGEGDRRFAAFRRALEALLSAGVEVFGSANGRCPPGDPRRRFRDPAELEVLCPAGFAPLERALAILARETEAMNDFLVDEVGEGDPYFAWFATQLARVGEETEAARKDLAELLQPDPNDAARVYWKEWTGAEAFSLAMSPLEVGPALVPSLKRGPSRVIFTSATLAAGEDFGFFARETGLDGDLHALALPSPFDYPKQILAVAVDSGPDPREEGYPLQTASTLHALMEDPGRKAMALFTSYKDLRAVAEALSSLQPHQAYSLFCQGNGESPARLLEGFRTVKRGLLLGTAGFWQGIDLPGDALEVLVLTRLPFGVPTDPRFQARSERIEREGGNPFMDLYLPEAVLRFKQGFGRLIRRASDRGVLAVLDPRLLTKNYGRRFTRVLPVPVEPAADGADLARRSAAWWRAGECVPEAIPFKGD